MAFLVGVFCFQTSAFSQANQVDKQGRKQGDWVQYWENSEVLRYKGKFKDDRPIGKFIYYYPTGEVRTIMVHAESGNRTEAFYYHINEELIAYGIYRDQKKDSVWTHFMPTGHYSYIETYKNGELNGEHITYYGPDVVEKHQRLILRKANYVNGRLNGDFIEYFPDGVVKAKGKYKDGVYDGVIIKNHPNGKPMLEERWKGRAKHGWWKTFDESGKEVGRKYFRKGTALEGEELEKYLKELKEKGINPNN